MEELTPATIRPTVKMANYFEVVPGARWGEREIPDLELILVVAGRFALDVAGDRTYGAGAGDVVCIFPGVRHMFRHADEGSRGVISCIHGELMEGRKWLAGDYRFLPVPQTITHAQADAALPDLFQRCRDAAQGYGRYRAELARAVVTEIWLRLAEFWAGTSYPRPSLRMRQMQQYVRDRLAEPVTRRDLARAFSITPEHVNALFRKELGITPSEFVNRERVNRAHRYLCSEGLSVKEAAARVGFSDPFYFSKLFKRLIGTPPSRLE